MPAYNAAQTLQSTFSSIPAGVVDEVLLVDDKSSDTTLDVAATLPIRTIALPHNVGYGGNQKTCYLEALRLGAEVVVMLHPDGQYDPVLLPDLVAPILAGEADMVLGSRMMTKGGARAGGMPLTRYGWDGNGSAESSSTSMRSFVARTTVHSKSLKAIFPGFAASGMSSHSTPTRCCRDPPRRH